MKKYFNEVTEFLSKSDPVFLGFSLAIIGVALVIFYGYANSGSSGPSNGSEVPTIGESKNKSESGFNDLQERDNTKSTTSESSLSTSSEKSYLNDNINSFSEYLPSLKEKLNQCFSQFFTDTANYKFLVLFKKLALYIQNNNISIFNKYFGLKFISVENLRETFNFLLTSLGNIDISQIYKLTLKLLKSNEIQGVFIVKILKVTFKLLSIDYFLNYVYGLETISNMI